MTEEIDYEREADEWRRWAGVLFRIGIALCVGQMIAVGLICYLLWKGCTG